MEDSKFTQKQLEALHARGKTIVSASAGSGKTTVMIEKIVRLILNGTDVSKILAVTFTKKAALQMKEKLKSSLVKVINNETTPIEEVSRLKKQLAAAQNADFSTIHSFCSSLIRTHYYAAGTSGDFSIIEADGAEGKELQGRALSALFETAYANNEPDFQVLLSVFFRKKKDDTLKSLILKVYDKIRNLSDYHEFLERGTQYNEEKFEDICTELLMLVKKKCKYFREIAEREKEYFEKFNADESAQKLMEEAACLIADFSDYENAHDYFSLKQIPQNAEGAKKKRGKTVPPELSEHAETLKKCKKAFNELNESALAIPTRKEAFDDYMQAGELAKKICKYVLLFEEKYDREKREKNVLDYSDLEHISLSLLSDEAVRKEIREKYDYVFVDEYQDVNSVQEKLLSAISGENVFLVGDVKQAIYGFRASKSEYFVKKYEEYKGESSGANAVSMNANFRSAPAILDAVNEIFAKAMRADTSYVDYETDGRMSEGAKRYPIDGRVCFHLVEKEKEKDVHPSGVYSVVERSKSVRDEKFNALKGRNAAGDEVARIVKEELNRTYFDADTGEEKKITYKDVAVLVRNKSQAKAIVAAFAFEGIPFSSCSSVKPEIYPEIKMAEDILSYIDNAEQDIPLCSALLSPVGDLLPRDLAAIKLAYPKSIDFRSACKAYAKEKFDSLSERLRAFFDYFSSLRDYASVACAQDVLTGLFSDCGVEAWLLSRKMGKESLKRLHYFLSLSLDPEPLSVHEFLVKLRLIKEKVEYKESAGENVVNILTMHSSKGLEYPVVILSDLCAGFSGSGDAPEVFIDEKFGVASKLFDLKTMQKRETLLCDLIKQKTGAQERSDELNIFYVALTRAKFALHAVFREPPSMNVLYAKKYSEFVSTETFQKYLVQPEKKERSEMPRQAIYSTEYDPVLSRTIYGELCRSYPFSGGENLPVKQSATAIMSEIRRKNRETAEENENRFTLEKYNRENEYDQEDGGEEERGVFSNGSDVRRLTGLAYHAFLQHANFVYLHAGGDSTAELVACERARMKKNGLLSEEYDALLDNEKLVRLLKNKVFLRFAELSDRSFENGCSESASGAQIYRERNFLASLPIKDVYFYDRERYGAIGEESTLFQGAADLLLIEKDRAHIVDYKYSTLNAAHLKEKYAPQLELYRKAIAKITGLHEKDVRCTLLNLCLNYAEDV